jgi:hypothetical protein
MTPHSNLDQIQTTILPLIAESSLEVCISQGLTFLGLLSISVPGTSQLDQGYSMPTRHGPVKDDKVQSLCLHHDVSWDRTATLSLQSFQVKVQLNCTPAHKGRFQATPGCDLERNCASKPTFSGLMCVYNGQEHGTVSASPCSQRADT